MIFPRPQKFTAEVIAKEYLNSSEKFLLVRFKSKGTLPLEFIAGQYFSFKINEKGERRSYSLASDIDDGEFEIVVDVEPVGIGSEFLKALNIGQEVDTLGPLGRFVVSDAHRQSKLLFVATGSGIVPLKSMIDGLFFKKRDRREITLYWGLRRRSDIFWLNDFQLLKNKYSNFDLKLCLSHPGEAVDHLEGRVTTWISEHFETLKDYEAYVCGSREMIADVKNLLKEKGMASENFHEEQFF